MWKVAAILALLSLLLNPLTFLLVCLGFALSYAVFRYYKFVARYPKGPFPLPFIGNLDKMVPGRLDKFFRKFGKENPPVYTVFIPFPSVQITDYDTLREAFVEKGEDFIGRPDNPVLQEGFSFSPNTGVLNSNGDTWREQRRVAISIMRDFGMGKNAMEELVRSSISDFLAHLDTLPDKSSVDLHWPIQVAVGNVINEVLFGYRYAYDRCQPLVDYVKRFNKLIESISEDILIAAGMALPVLAKLPWIRWHVVGRFKQEMQTINQYVVDNVERSLEDYNVDDEPRCFVHAYSQRMGEDLDRVNLISTCFDFFLAGQETTSTTLRWAMLIMAKHVDIQEKLRREIHEVVGLERLPLMADQVKMPFARACVLELQRFANIVGMNIQRMTVNDVTIRDVTIPAGTWVHGDIHYLMANDPHFTKPDEFRPERYLTEDGKSLQKDLVERTLPFSLGKRVCAGESLARAEIFLGLTAMIQHYRILPRDGEQIDLEPERVNTLCLPKPQFFRLEKVVKK